MLIIAESTQENEIVKKLAEQNGSRAVMREDAFAVTYWSVSDVIGRNLDNLTKEGAEKFLETFEKRLTDSSVEGGNDFLDYADYDGYSTLNETNAEYELVEICDKLMLFTNERIRKWQVPEGLYLYHLRESDDGDRFCSIEIHVGVNHGGSVLSKEPIDIGSNGCVSFNEDTEPNFIGCGDISIQDFVSGNFTTD